MMLTKEDYELRDNTDEYEIVDEEDFIEAFIRTTFLQDYNWTHIKEYDSYFTISSPSPKSNFCGYHKTLVLEKCGTDKNNNLTSISLIGTAIETALRFGKRDGLNMAIKKLEEVEDDE